MGNLSHVHENAQVERFVAQRSADLRQAEYFQEVLTAERAELYARISKLEMKLARSERVRDSADTQHQQHAIKKLKADLYADEGMLRTLEFRLAFFGPPMERYSL